MKVLFVCTGNAFRSPYAEALLKKLKPDVEVDSAGLNPVLPISEVARRFLARENAEKHLKKSSEGLDMKPLRTYDLIVAMMPRHRDLVIKRCPECVDRTTVWNIEDPYLMSLERAEKLFNQIKRKVEALANSLCAG